MSDDAVYVHYLFAWLRECPQFRSHVVQRTHPDQEEPQYLLSPDAFYYHSRWLYDLSLTVPRYTTGRLCNINGLQEVIHVSRLPFFAHSCTRNFSYPL